GGARWGFGGVGRADRPGGGSPAVSLVTSRGCSATVAHAPRLSSARPNHYSRSLLATIHARPFRGYDDDNYSGPPEADRRFCRNRPPADCGSGTVLHLPVCRWADCHARAAGAVPDGARPVCRLVFGPRLCAV